MSALWMVLGSLLFALMAVCVKLASGHFNAAELVFYRGLVGLVFIGLLARYKGISLATRYPLMHAWRSVMGVSAMAAWFHAIAALSIATATTLNYMSSIWMAVFVLAGSLMHWRPGAVGEKPPLNLGLMLTIVTGFAGVLLILGPGMDSPQSMRAALIGLYSGLAGALAYMQVVVMARMGEPDARVVFYFALGCTVAGGLVMPVAGISSLNHMASIWLMPIGLFAAMGQLCLTRAFSASVSPRNTLIVSSLQYSGIVFAALFSLVLFDDPIDLMGWIGMAVIIASGIAATLMRAR